MSYGKVLFIFFIVCYSAVESFKSSNVVRLLNSALNMKSKALPFIEAPAKLDGTTIGDFGFDPLGFTNTLNDLSYVKAAELKHCRVAMLAVVGFLVQQQFHFLSNEADPLKAISSIGWGPNLQILSFIGVIELATWQKTFFGSDPGNLGFDPLGQAKGKSPQQLDDLKLKEVKNGRLAMIAIVGLIFQNLAFEGRPSLQF